MENQEKSSPPSTLPFKTWNGNQDYQVSHSFLSENVMNPTGKVSHSR